jgi:hypothetical protein
VRIVDLELLGAQVLAGDGHLDAGSYQLLADLLDLGERLPALVQPFAGASLVPRQDGVQVGAAAQVARLRVEPARLQPRGRLLSASSRGPNTPNLMIQLPWSPVSSSASGGVYAGATGLWSCLLDKRHRRFQLRRARGRMEELMFRMSRRYARYALSTLTTALFQLPCS